MRKRERMNAIEARGFPSSVLREISQRQTLSIVYHSHQALTPHSFFHPQNHPSLSRNHPSLSLFFLSLPMSIPCFLLQTSSLHWIHSMDRIQYLTFHQISFFDPFFPSCHRFMLVSLSTDFLSLLFLFLFSPSVASLLFSCCKDQGQFRGSGFLCCVRRERKREQKRR